MVVAEDNIGELTDVVNDGRNIEEASNIGSTMTYKYADSYLVRYSVPPKMNSAACAAAPLACAIASGISTGSRQQPHTKIPSRLV
jgi:hypothetical protein